MFIYPLFFLFLSKTRLFPSCYLSRFPVWFGFAFLYFLRNGSLASSKCYCPTSVKTARGSREHMYRSPITCHVAFGQVDGAFTQKCFISQEWQGEILTLQPSFKNESVGYQIFADTPGLASLCVASNTQRSSLAANQKQRAVWIYPEWKPNTPLPSKIFSWYPAA